jgi:hypothetical protein
MTAHSTHLVLVPGLACTEDLFAEQIGSLRGKIAISIADHARKLMTSARYKDRLAASLRNALHIGQDSAEAADFGPAPRPIPGGQSANRSLSATGTRA